MPIAALEVCYFIGAASGRGCIKIGRAKNVFARLRQLQASSPETLVVLGILPGGPAMEKHLHSKFRDLRSHFEWFRRDERGELLAFIEKECTAWEEVG